MRTKDLRLAEQEVAMLPTPDEKAVGHIGRKIRDIPQERREAVFADFPAQNSKR